ncbi:MAG TPA: HEAT repeat domain-containing protein [Planctomycetaceae bacterium]
MATRFLTFAITVCLAFPVFAFADESQDVDVDIGELTRELRAINRERRVHAAEMLGKMGPAAAPAIRGLISALSDPSFEVQTEVLITLGHIGPTAREAVPGLILILKDKDARLYGPVMDTLATIGRDAAPAAPLLVEFLHGDDEQLAMSACLALLKILPPESDELREAVPILVAALKSQAAEVRSQSVIGLGHAGKLALPDLIKLVKGWVVDPQSAAQAAAALEIMGRAAQPAVPVLVTALESKDEQVVIHAAGALGAIGRSGIGRDEAGSGLDAAVPRLKKLLTHQSSSIRAHVASSLGDIGPDAANAVNDLTTALEDRDEAVRRESAEALGKIGPAAKSAIPALLKALGDDKNAVTMHAAWALGRLGSDAVPQLVETLQDPKRRYEAVVILGGMGPAAEPAVGALTALLSEPKLGVNLGREIVLALAHIGPAARAAVPALLKILEDDESPLRAGAAWALAKIDDREARETVLKFLIKNLPRRDDSELSVVAPMALLMLARDNDALTHLVLPRVVELLAHDSPQVKSEAAASLAALGEKAALAVPNLDAGLHDADPSLRIAFLSTLAAIGPAAVDALPNIARLLADPVMSVRYAASHAIGKMGKAAQEAAPRLEKNLKDPDEFLQFVSAWALVQVDPGRKNLAAMCVGPLVRSLSHQDPHVRSEAVAALSLLGGQARSAVPALEAIANDPNETVRQSVADALKKIAD